jgi:8-oxo-dGTP pyrophosphatase MutT (NUDIX family)
MKSPWKTLSEQTVYDNPWIRVSHREVITPTGTDGIYGLVQFKNIAIGVVPVDEAGHTYLVGQYRYALGQYSWEIPEGGCPIGEESPLQSAKRELREETGIRAERWEEIARLHTSNSVTDEAGIVYLARGLHFGDSRPEETEELKVKKLTLEEALRWVEKGEITDAVSMIGLMRVGRMLGL